MISAHGHDLTNPESTWWKTCCTCQCLWLQHTFFPRTRFKNMGIKFKHAGMSSLQRGGLYLIAGVLLITINTLMWFILNWLMRNDLSRYFNGTCTCIRVFGVWLYFLIRQPTLCQERALVRKTFLLPGRIIKQSSRFQSPGSTLNVWVVRGGKTDNTFHEIPAEIRHLLFFTSVF